MAGPTVITTLAKTGLLLQGERFISSTATGGSTSTLIDTGRLQDDTRGTIYKRGYIAIWANSDPNRFRRISGDAPTTGTLTLSGPVLAQTASGVAYQAWPSYNPRFALSCLNNVLEKLQIVEESTFSVSTDDVRQFVMTTDAAWLTNPEFQVVGLDLRKGTIASAYTYSEVGGVQWLVDEGIVTLNLTQETFKTTDVLRLRTLRTLASASMSGSALSAGTDTVTVANTADVLAWLAAETCLEMIEVPYDSWMGAESQAARDATEKRVRAAVAKWRNRFVERVGRKLWAADTGFWGLSGRGTV